MVHFNHNAQLLLHHLTEGNVSKLTLTHMLKSFSISMISLFVPIFLYEIGYSIIQILVYMLLYYILSFVFMPLALKFTAKFGIKVSIFISLIFSLGYFIVLYSNVFVSSVLGIYGFLFVIMILNKTSEFTYWMAFHLDFATNFDNKKEGSQIGLLEFLASFSSIIAPFLGAFLITTYSFSFVFLVVISILLFSFVPIIFSENVVVKHNFKYSSMIKGKNKKFNLLYFIDGFHSMGVGFFWPFFMFFSSIVIASIGIFYTLSNFLASISNYVMGKISDKVKSEAFFMRIGIISHGFTIIIRPFMSSLSSIGIVQGLGGITGPIYDLPYSRSYFKITKDDPINRIANREFYLAIGRASVFLIALIIFLFLPLLVAFTVVIVLSGIITLSALFVSKALDEV